MNRYYLIGLLALALPVAAETEPQSNLHKKVAAALAWDLPVNHCVKPRILVRASNVVDAEGSREITDIDSNTIGRYERKEERWKACVAKYKKKLLADFTTLRDSAQYGLTKPQADQILQKMAHLQSVYTSPDGMPPAENEVSAPQP